MSIQDQRSGDLGNGYYTNPIMGGDYPDPTICRDGEDYYMTHSATCYAPGFILWHSKDLVNWEPVQTLLTESKLDIWAPDLCKYKDTFYLYYCAEGHNYVMTAKDPYGKWDGPFMMRKDGKGGEPIDPCHIADVKTGERWIFGSGGHAARVDAEGLDYIEEQQVVYPRAPFPQEWMTEGDATEGSKLFYKDGYYYMVIAQGGTAGPSTSHMVTAMRAKELTGPWELSPYNPILRTKRQEESWWSRGHATVIEDAHGKWWIYYHTYQNNYRTLGRQNNLEPLEWTEDGWFKVPEEYFPDRPWEKPIGPAVEGKLELSNDFKGDKLPIACRFFSEDDVAGRYRMTGDGIAIKAKGNAPEDASPLTIQAHHRIYRCQVETTIQDACESGLMLFYNKGAYCGISCDKEFVYLTVRKGWKINYGKHNLSGKIYFRIDNVENDTAHYWSADGENWNKLEYCPEVSGMQHNIFGQYLALKPALLAQCEGEAVFKDYKYWGLA